MRRLGFAAACVGAALCATVAAAVDLATRHMRGAPVDWDDDLLASPCDPLWPADQDTWPA